MRSGHSTSLMTKSLSGTSLSKCLAFARRSNRSAGGYGGTPRLPPLMNQLRYCDSVVEIHILNRMEQLDALCPRPLERLPS